MRILNHALIMAAGRGIRMRPLTAAIPKPMAPYMGSTLIAEGIKNLKPHIPNIHITVGYKGPMLAEHVIELEVTSVFNTGNRGNAWWLYNTLMKYLNEPVVVLTCDNLVELDFEKLAKHYSNLNEPATMVVPVKPVPGLEGDYIFQEENVVVKLDRHEVSDRYCSGIQILNPFRVNQLTSEAYDFHDVWNQLIRQRQVYCSDIYPKRWSAVDTLEQLCKLNGGEALIPTGRTADD